MSTWKIKATCLLLTVLCVFSTVGYAAVSSNLRVLGSIKNDVPLGLFITSVSNPPISASKVDTASATFMEYTTTVDATINRASSGTGVVTFEVTVLNNTNLTYSYRRMVYQSDLDGYNGNSYITTTKSERSKIFVTNSLEGVPAEQKKVKPGETLTFTVTYTLGSGMNSSRDWRTLINFQFGINVDGEREALEVVENKFLDVLNTKTTYDRLIDSLDNKFDGRQEWTSNYIGNVTGSTSDDSVAVNNLFAGQLQITVGDDNMDATVLIKHENLDGNNYTGDDYVAVNDSNGGEFRGYGCEMTLYLTIDPLKTSGAYVPVYVVVFTCDRNENGDKISEWYRIGTTYAGEANVVTYDGGNGTGSFVTDNWRAEGAVYQIIDGYSFNIDGETYEIGALTQTVATNASIKTIVSEVDNRATQTFEKLLDDAKRLLDNGKYAGIGIDLIDEAYVKYASWYTRDENGNHTVSQNITYAKLTPAIMDIYRVVNEALSEIESLDKNN